ncbi:MAG: hypothetical protein LBJ83_01610 [Oscillospiraceae bacterium]|jgi:hypothetical protein|nr:hypothetical protein [Oscillospiraceae bacterium]
MVGTKKFIFRTLLLTISVTLIVAATHIFSPVKIHQTISARECTHSLSFKTTGLIIRDEETLNLGSIYGPNIIVEHAKRNGEHIRINEPMLIIYRSASDIHNVNELAKLKMQRVRLLELMAHAHNIYASSEILAKSISEPLLKLVKSIKNRDLDSIQENNLNFLTLINKKKLATGQETQYTSRIAALNTRIQTLECTKPEILGTHPANATGCFFSFIDGYETLSTSEIFSQADDANLEQIYASMMQKKEEKNPLHGVKIVTNYNWFMVTLVDEIIAKNILKHQNNITLNFGFKGGQMVPAKLRKTINSKLPGKQFLVFSSNYMNSRLAALRICVVSICTGNVKGIKFQTSAIRFLNGKKGVFTKEGTLIKFKQVDVVYQDENITISAVKPGQHGYLECLDEIIVKSKNLFTERAV